MPESVPEPSLLQAFEDNWETDKGSWVPGESVTFRGKNLFTEVSEMGWLGMLIYGAIGKRLSETQIRLVENLMIMGTSFPDPRLWNNRIAALVGTVRGTTCLALSASAAVSEATIYGHRPIIKAFDFLQEARREKQQGRLKEFVRKHLKTHKVAPGFGRPITRVDERIQPLMNKARDLNCADGEYVRLAFEIEEYLLSSRYRMGINVAGLGAALMADQGFSAREHSLIFQICFFGGFFPCYVDALEKPEGTFFPLSCQRIAYQGVGARKWSD